MRLVSFKENNAINKSVSILWYCGLELDWLKVLRNLFFTWIGCGFDFLKNYCFIWKSTLVREIWTCMYARGGQMNFCGPILNWNSVIFRYFGRFTTVFAKNWPKKSMGHIMHYLIDNFKRLYFLLLFNFFSLSRSGKMHLQMRFLTHILHYGSEFLAENF